MIARTYNTLRNPIPAKRQIEMIKEYWKGQGKRIKDIGVNKEDRRYITYTVLI